MNDLAPRTPYRPLTWTDMVLDIRDLLADVDGPLYIVGGAVRDAMLNRPIKDLDIATPGDSIAVAKTIANALPGGALYIMDVERGVARAIIDTMHGKMNVDVAQFRGETDDILADVIDRDFTINAMMVDLHGDMSKIIDPLNGERDVAGKIIRRCGEGSIKSDPARALRALRQSIQLGFRIEPETLKDVRAANDLLGTVSAERVRDELFKILALRRPAAALRVMQRIGLLDAILPVTEISSKEGVEHIFTAMDKLAGLLAGFFPGETDNLASDLGYGMAVMQLNRVRKRLEDYLPQTWADDRPQRALLMAALLLRNFPVAEVRQYADALRLSSAERKRLMTIIEGWHAVFELPDTSPLMLHRYWYAFGEGGVDIGLLTLADYLADQGVHLEQKPWLQLIDRVRVLLEAYYLQYEQIVKPPVLVTGDDLIQELALEPGKVIGQLLTAIREAQVVGDVETADDAIRYARAALGE